MYWKDDPKMQLTKTNTHINLIVIFAKKCLSSFISLNNYTYMARLLGGAGPPVALLGWPVAPAGPPVSYILHCIDIIPHGVMSSL